MNEKEFQDLKNVQTAKEVITVDDLDNKNDRTLLFGYTKDLFWHVYLEHNVITTLIYSYYYSYYNCYELTYSKDIRFNRRCGDKENYDTAYYNEIEISQFSDYIPDKRLIPAKCDYEFCKLLLERGVHLPFTTESWEFEEKQFYGLVL